MSRADVEARQTLTRPETTIGELTRPVQTTHDDGPPNKRLRPEARPTARKEQTVSKYHTTSVALLTAKVTWWSNEPHPIPRGSATESPSDNIVAIGNYPEGDSRSQTHLETKEVPAAMTDSLIGLDSDCESNDQVSVKAGSLSHADDDTRTRLARLQRAIDLSLEMEIYLAFTRRTLKEAREWRKRRDVDVERNAATA